MMFPDIFIYEFANNFIFIYMLLIKELNRDMLAVNQKSFST